ncbi:MAG: transcriptional regulator [Rhodobacterales bacterium]|nr:transcriptional regulator [Rhodobacterales bacterium]
MTNDQQQDAPRRQAIREQINENLRLVYAATLNEDLPDRFRTLLAQLKNKDGSGPGSAA